MKCTKCGHDVTDEISCKKCGTRTGIRDHACSVEYKDFKISEMLEITVSNPVTKGKK